MYRKRKGVILLGLVMLGVFVLWFAGHGRIPGSRLVEWIPVENIARVTVRKTLETSGATEELVSHDLTPAEIQQFYHLLSETRLEDLGKRSFSITTEDRVYVSFVNSRGDTEGTMKFYGDKALIFDYAYGDRPAIHKRYSIDPSSFSSLKNFFAAYGRGTADFPS